MRFDTEPAERMRFSGRQTQFYIDVAYGLAFSAGFGYLLFVGLDARVAAFQGGLVLGYFLRVWENMTVYERILEEEVAAEAEDAVAEEVEARVPDEAADAVTEQVEEQVPAEVEQRVEERVPEEVEQRVPAELEQRVDDRLNERVQATVDERVRREVDERIGDAEPDQGSDPDSTKSDASGPDRDRSASESVAEDDG